MVEAARREAESVLLDRCFFALSERAFSEFTAALDRPPATNPRLHRNMPDPVPVMVIGRLAVDQGHRGPGIGKGLLRDAILRAIAAGEIVGIRALLVHAISQEARKFYERCGFRSSPIDPMTLMITLVEAKNALGSGK